MPVYDARYEEDLRLDDGTPVFLRLVRPDDKASFARAFARLSSETVYRRFAALRGPLTPRELAYLTEVDGETHLALVAGVRHPASEGGSFPSPLGAAQPRRGSPGRPAPRGSFGGKGALLARVAGRTEAGVGVARFVRLPETPDVAEPAIVVVDGFQGRGLGRALLERLVAAARERQVRAFRFVVLAENAPMRTLVREHLPASVETTDGDEVVIEVPLDAPVEEGALAAGAPPAPAPRSLLSRLLALAAASAIRLRLRLWPGPPP